MAKTGMERWANGQTVTFVDCDCGHRVYCTDFTNTCDCGVEYNPFGQKLAPREQWMEDWDSDY